MFNNVLMDMHTQPAMQGIIKRNNAYNQFIFNRLIS